MRLFLALKVPRALHDVLRQLQDQLPPSVRRTRPEQFHVTLLFLGERHDLQELRERLRHFHAASFSVTTTRTGAFSSAAWLGVEGVRHLHTRLAAYLQLSPGPFQAHITLGRAHNIQSLLAGWEGRQYRHRWTVRSFTLYQSLLPGPRYIPIEHYPLESFKRAR